MPDNSYPSSASECLDRNMKFKAAVLHAVREFAKSKPWRGNLEERKAKFQQLHAKLCAIYGKRTTLTFGVLEGGDSVGSHYSPMSDTITLVGKLSAITFMHEWGHVLWGASELKACRWSLNLFRRCCPKSFERLRFEGHLARRDNPPQSPAP